MTTPVVVRFPLADLAEQVDAFAARWPDAVVDRAGHVFVTADRQARLRVPLRALRVQPGETVAAYAARLGPVAERVLVLLLQAGAMAFGYWDGDELVDHKAERRYVVRGRGRAQPLHQKTRGKSRYGSRLRLQNWRRLLRDTNERLTAAIAACGEPERIFLAVPVRVLPDLFAADPPPPFGRRDARLQRCPVHVHRPDFAELQRIHGWLGHGRLELPGPG